MNKDPKISHIQLRGLIVSTIIGVGVLSMQSTLAEEMGPDGWIAILIAGILMIPLFAVYNKIFKLYPDKDFFEIGKTSLGFFFNIIMLVMVAYLVLVLAIVARTLGELIKIFLLQRTPLEAIIIVFIISTSYIATYEIDVIARAGYFIYPVIIIFAVIIVLISLPKANFSNVLPVFQNDIPSTIKGVYSVLFSFTGIEVSLFAIPFVENKSKVFKSGLIGIFIVTIIYFALYIMTLTHFSIEQISHINYPILMLIRQLDLPGFFLENLDGTVLGLWVIVVFGTMAPIYFAAGKVLSKLFRIKRHKYFIWILVPVIYFVSLIPENFIELNVDMARYFNIGATIVVVITPIIILIASSIRKKVKK